MARPLLQLVLILTLLAQGQAAAWATTMPVAAAAVVVEQTEMMPCHGAADAGDAMLDEAATMPCCEAGMDCARCATGCVSASAPPASVAAQTAHADTSPPTLARVDAPPAAPPLELLRPPIVPLR